MYPRGRRTYKHPSIILLKCHYLPLVYIPLIQHTSNMSDQRATSPISVPHQRRSSLASLSLGSQPVRPHPIATSTPGASTSAGSRPRRLSITTLGLSGSPTQTSPFGASASAGGNGNGKHLRGGSLSSSTGSAAGYPEELISEESENSSATTTGGSGSGSGPNPSPFSRRVSFGAHALRDVRRGSVNNGMNFSKKTKTAKEKKANRNRRTLQLVRIPPHPRGTCSLSQQHHPLRLSYRPEPIPELGYECCCEPPD